MLDIHHPRDAFSKGIRSLAHLIVVSHSREDNGPHALAAALVQRAKAGDRTAFDELVRRYRARIFALILHLTGNESDADDITQEVFFRAYQALAQFAGRSEFFTWVYRIAVNRALNANRKRSRRSETSLEDPRLSKAVEADASGDPAKAAELRQTYSRLLQALDRLPSGMRTTVVLVALQGLSHAEAAVVQRCSMGTIAWRIHAARQRLYRALMVSPGSRPAGPRLVQEPVRISNELNQLLDGWNLPALAPS